jgi:tetratricopeptide (TPR) repeat protein
MYNTSGTPHHYSPYTRSNPTALAHQTALLYPERYTPNVAQKPVEGIAPPTKFAALNISPQVIEPLSALAIAPARLRTDARAKSKPAPLSEPESLVALPDAATPSPAHLPAALPPAMAALAPEKPVEIAPAAPEAKPITLAQNLTQPAFAPPAPQAITPSADARLPQAVTPGHSALAISAPSADAIRNYQMQRGIIAGGNAGYHAGAPRILQALPATLPAPSRPDIAPSIAHDIIEPGISYAPEPESELSQIANNTPIALGQALDNPTGYQTQLSSDISQMLAGLPNHLGEGAPVKSGKIKVNRVSPDIIKIVAPDQVEASYEAAGIKIEVTRPGLDSNYELSRAYDALISGDTLAAVRVYKNILSVEPENEEALFGLAATLHRVGAVDKARGLYASLLRRNPTHKEALNNYLSLVGSDAPADALFDLAKLKARNPNFSPISAQMGMLHARLGNFTQARAALLEAISLAPENLVYQYNLAVVLDQQGNYPDAAALYAALMKAHRNGAKLPVDMAQLQSRYSFLSQMLSKRMRLSQAQ